jgi:hypothetical protein
MKMLEPNFLKWEIVRSKLSEPCQSCSLERIRSSKEWKMLFEHLKRRGNNAVVSVRKTVSEELNCKEFALPANEFSISISFVLLELLHKPLISKYSQFFL